MGGGGSRDRISADSEQRDGSNRKIFRVKGEKRGREIQADREE